MIYIGTAGWSIPRAVAAEFPASGTHLEKFAAKFHGVEINSTFYRPHKPATFARWAASVPETFRFSVKIPKAITHELKLVNAGSLLTAFQLQIEPLGQKLGGLLVQLPPSLQFDASVAGDFFDAMRVSYEGAIALEPRHPSWFAPDVTQLLVEKSIARVAADPAVIPAAALPGGADAFVYVRLHGSPRIYYSAYDDVVLKRMADTLVGAERQGVNAWCIFDNTASGAAAADALRLMSRIGKNGLPRK